MWKLIFLNFCSHDSFDFRWWYLQWEISVHTTTAWKLSKCVVFLVRIFLHLDWIRRDAKYARYLSVFSPNAGKYGPEKTLYLDAFHAVNPHNHLIKHFKSLSLFKDWKVLNTQKKLILIQKETTLLFMLTKPRTMTLISSNRSASGDSNIVRRSLNFLILPIRRFTWIGTLQSYLDVSNLLPKSWFFPFLKRGPIIRFLY